MATMLNTDIERSLLDHIQAAITDGVSIHLPGEVFSPERHREWIEVRIETLDHEQQSRPGEEVIRLILGVRCFIKVEQKGARRLELSALADKVLDVIGGERNVNGAHVVDCDRRNIGVMSFQASRQSRVYGTQVTIAGVSIVGLDVATIRVTVLVTGCPRTT